MYAIAKKDPSVQASKHLYSVSAWEKFPNKAAWKYDLKLLKGSRMCEHRNILLRRCQHYLNLNIKSVKLINTYSNTWFVSLPDLMPYLIPDPLPELIPDLLPELIPDHILIQYLKGTWTNSWPKPDLIPEQIPGLNLTWHPTCYLEPEMISHLLK